MFPLVWPEDDDWPDRLLELDVCDEDDPDVWVT
jgi:hypothetical protein